MDDREPEDLSESEYLHGEARHARVAMHRTLDDLRRAGRQLTHPRQTFKEHPWVSTGVLVVIGALLGLTAYGLFFRAPAVKRSGWVHLRNGRFGPPRRRRGIIRTALRAMTWLGGNLAMLKALGSTSEYEDPESYESKLRGP